MKHSLVVTAWTSALAERSLVVYSSGNHWEKSYAGRVRLWPRSRPMAKGGTRSSKSSSRSAGLLDCFV